MPCLHVRLLHMHCLLTDDAWPPPRSRLWMQRCFSSSSMRSGRSWRPADASWQPAGRSCTSNSSRWRLCSSSWQRRCPRRLPPRSSWVKCSSSCSAAQSVVTSWLSSWAAARPLQRCAGSRAANLLACVRPGAAVCCCTLAAAAAAAHLAGAVAAAATSPCRPRMSASRSCALHLGT